MTVGQCQEHNPPRIVSLIPSATEIVASLGLGDSLVGGYFNRPGPRLVESLETLQEILGGSWESTKADDAGQALMDRFRRFQFSCLS